MTYAVRMSSSFRRPSLNRDRTFYAVYADGDTLTFPTAEEARHDVASLPANTEFWVAEWNVAEGRCFDVTPDFIREDATDDEPDAGYAHADHFSALFQRIRNGA